MIEIGTIDKLAVFPLTSGQAQFLDIAKLGAAGIVGDRRLVMCDGNINPTIEDNRISQTRRRGDKHFRDLARIAAIIAPDTSEIELKVPGAEPLLLPFSDAEPDCVVNEFGDLTPAIDMGEKPAQLLQNFFDYPNLRLRQKSADWLKGLIIKPADRRNAPVHIATTPTIEFLEDLRTLTDSAAERLRVSILLNTETNPFIEHDWLGRLLQFSNVSVELTRLTPRCPQPGFNSKTGENMKDIPALYRQVPKDPETKKPVIGVYGFAHVQIGKVIPITVGEPVRLNVG